MAAFRPATPLLQTCHHCLQGNANSEIENDILGKLRAVGIGFDSLESIYLAQTTPEDNELKMMAATLAYYDVRAVLHVHSTAFSGCRHPCLLLHSTRTRTRMA